MEATMVPPTVQEEDPHNSQSGGIATQEEAVAERLPHENPDYQSNDIAPLEEVVAEALAEKRLDDQLSGIVTQEEAVATSLPQEAAEPATNAQGDEQLNYGQSFSSSSEDHSNWSNGQDLVSSTTSRINSFEDHQPVLIIETELFPPELDDRQCLSLWTEKEELTITKPFDYVAALPGKNFRAQILSALNVWFQVDGDSLKAIDRVVAKLHNASLLIDDIQDGSALRRGFPAAHCVFGTAQSINAANYAYFLAQQELLGLPNSSELMQIFVEELLNLHRGQGIELFWRETLTVPTEEEYLLMISNKTGGLFRLATRLMQAISSIKIDILPLTELVGLIFQIHDDYQNLCSEQMATAKGFCEDLTEGKFSLPVIHAIYNSGTTNNEVLNILKLHTSDVTLKSHALWFMKTQTKSLEYTKNRLAHFHNCAEAMLARIGMRNDSMGALLGKLKLD